MARSRNKTYKQGDRINIYLSKDLSPDFLEWINKQSDLSNFFLYAAHQLYEKTGFVDVAEVMPRKLNFDLSAEQKITVEEKKAEPIQVEREEDTKEKTSWQNIENLNDDPYA